MSGFSVSSKVGGVPRAFLSFSGAVALTRQSETAAAQTATCTGSAARQAASICSAVST